MLRHRSRPFSALFSIVTPSSARKRTRTRPQRRRLRALESLENRRLLAATIYTVNATTDTGAGSGTTGDLLYCIDQANANPNTDGSVIQFDPTVFGTPQTITLSSTLSLSETAGPEEIDGPGASLVTISGNNAVGVFSVFGPTPGLPGATASISGLTIASGMTEYGGGIDNNGTLTLTDCTISGNIATSSNLDYGFGGGIFNAANSSLTVTDCTIYGNGSVSEVEPFQYHGYGGGINNDGGTVTVSGSTIAGNGSNFGGGIFNNQNSTFTINNSSIDDNNGGGAGVDNFGTFSIIGSTLANNDSVNVTNSGTLSLTNSTIFGLDAPFGGSEGVVNDGAATVTDSTIADNPQGGLRNDDNATLTLNNTIVALNGTDIFGTVSLSSSYNLIGQAGSSGGLTNGVNGNQEGVADPGLGSLADNGGPTQTIALLPGSPAIDAGSNNLAVDPTTGQPLVYDQRGAGFPRIVDNTVDIGAFEFSGVGLAVTTQPHSSITAGTDFGLTVTAEDASGNVDTSFNGTITVALLNNPTGTTLGGTLTVTAQDGVANFSDLTLDTVGSGYTLIVSASDAGTRPTDAFDVTPATASQLVVTALCPTLSESETPSSWASRLLIPSEMSIPTSAAA